MSHRAFAVLLISFTLIFPSVVAAAPTDPVVNEAIIDAPVSVLWNAFTTKEGVESWMVAHAEIDLRIGGLMRTTYKPDGVIGDDSTIENIYMSYQPQRMLSFRVHKAPKNFPFQTAIQKMWTVILLEPITETQTKLTITSNGFEDNEESQKMRQHFIAGNTYTLNKLKEKFASTETPSDPAAVLAKLHTLVGGEWIHEDMKPDGTVFRTRSITELGPDGKSIISKGWFGDVDGMIFHSALQVWRAPANAPQPNAILFHCIDQDGSLASGSLRLEKENSVVWDWNSTDLNGEFHRYRVEMNFQDTDHYQFVLFLRSDIDERRELVNFVYTRVPKAPPAFTKMKNAS